MRSPAFLRREHGADAPWEVAYAEGEAGDEIAKDVKDFGIEQVAKNMLAFFDGYVVTDGENDYRIA